MHCTRSLFPTTELYVPAITTTLQLFVRNATSSIAVFLSHIFNSIQSYCFAHHLSFLSISMLMLMRWCHNYSCHCYCCFLYFLVTLLISVNVTVLRSCQLLIIPLFFYFFKLVVIARKAQMHRHSHITTAHVISTAPLVIFMHFS